MMNKNMKIWMEHITNLEQINIKTTDILKNK